MASLIEKKLRNLGVILQIRLDRNSNSKCTVRVENIFVSQRTSQPINILFAMINFHFV